MRFTILGSGSSGGVPRIGNDWGGCDPNEPKNRRRRSSFLVEKVGLDGTSTVLVDTSPDIRAQLLDSGVSCLDGVIYTHDHADHVHGIDDLRVVYFNTKQRIPVYFDSVTGASLRHKFSYCFEQAQGSGYAPILKGQEIVPGMPIEIDGPGGAIEVTPFEQIHGNGHSVGLRFGSLVYATDVNAFSESSLDYLEGLDVLILDALRYNTHPCHFSVDQALELIERFGPKRAILTHMHIDLDYQSLKASLPCGVEPAYDGMVIELDEGPFHNKGSQLYLIAIGIVVF